MDLEVEQEQWMSLFIPRSLKEDFPIFWSSIQKYYQSSSPPPKVLPKLSPRDLHSKWRANKDEELSSAVMKVAPYVVSVSVFIGVRRILDCSGVIIEWDESNEQATVISSAKIMRFSHERGDYYFSVRLANGEILLAEEDYVDFYHNIVTLKVKSDTKLEPLELHLSPEGALGTAEGFVAALGRNFYTCKLIESSGFIRKDYPYFGCELLVSSTCSGSENLEGGPLINRMGHVCGINFFDGSRFVHPLPTSVIRSCLDKWNSCGGSSVLRPWFGLTVIDIAQLPHDELEKIAKVSGDSTAVVKEVYEGSPADKFGVLPGDTVITLQKSLKRIAIKSASQYAQELSSISGELSAYSPVKTPPDIQVLVHGNDSHIRKVVCAENLQVNDRKFSSSWLGDGPDWCSDPLFGSQTESALEINAAHEDGMKTNVISEPTGSESGAEDDTGTDDNVSLYSGMHNPGILIYSFQYRGACSTCLSILYFFWY